MALLDSEIARLKAELGFSLVSTANPYIGTTMLFEQIIQPYLTGGASTTSATSVTAASSPTPVTLTLTSGTGFSSGDRVVVDVDTRQEVVTAQLVSGASLTVQLSKTHSGTYPVTVEGGESLIREKLREIATAKTKMVQAYGFGSLKKVDDVEWYQAGGSVSSQFDAIASNIMWLREELAAILGITSMWANRRSGAQRMSVY